MRVSSMAEVSDGKILHLLYSPFIANNIPELTISAVLIYFFRTIERRFGTKKYINYFIMTLLTSQIIRYWMIKLAYPLLSLERIPFPGSPLILLIAIYCQYILEIPNYFIMTLLTSQIIRYWMIKLAYPLLSLERIPFPGSPLILLISIYCQYILEIPVYAIYRWMEFIPISEHHFILFLLAQTFSTFTVLHFYIPAILSTIIYRLNLCYIQRISLIPEFIAQITRDSDSFLGSWIKMFEEIFETRKFKALPIAATLERQRIEEDDEIQRQMFQQHIGRNTARLMGVRRALGPPPETLIQSLVGMGFANRQEVIRALQEANHNIDVAANLLLQRTFS
uniref:UBA domain-containing protein n=1 Tax=Panagrolaimus sp. ES5 TaxID=591445 RepID=A0AC34GNQ1_9BILA